jgi:hypothetical protein
MRHREALEEGVGRVGMGVAPHLSRRSGSMSREWKGSRVGYSGTGKRKGQSTRKAPLALPRHFSTLPNPRRTTLQLERLEERISSSALFPFQHEDFIHLRLW